MTLMDATYEDITLSIESITEDICSDGSFTGMKSTTIKLSNTGKVLTLGEILAQCPQKLITFLGYENYEDSIVPLIDMLHLNEKMIYLETDGSIPLRENEHFDWIAAYPSRENNFSIHEDLNVGEVIYAVDNMFEYKEIPKEVFDRLHYGCIWVSTSKKEYDKCLELVHNNDNLRLSFCWDLGGFYERSKAD